MKIAKVFAIAVSLIFIVLMLSPTAYADQPKTTDGYVSEINPNPGTIASDKNIFLYEGAEHYLFPEWITFIIKGDGKCYNLGDVIKTVEKPDYKIRGKLKVNSTITSLVKKADSLGTLKYTSGALESEFDIRNEYFDKACVYANGSSGEYYLTIITSEPVCYVDKTAVYLAADAAKKPSTVGKYDTNKTGWQTVDGQKYYYKSGKPITKSTVIDGIRYKFNSNGVCTGKYTGWTKSDKGRRYWYHGKLFTNKIFTAGGVKYYADEKGYVSMVTTTQP